MVVLRSPASSTKEAFKSLGREPPRPGSQVDESCQYQKYCSQKVQDENYRASVADSNHNYPIAKNLLDRKFAPGAVAKAWVSDITYIRTTRGWLYLTVVVDLADRKVIGWALSETMKTCDTVIPAWKMAIKNRPIVTELIFHRSGDPVGQRCAVCLS